MHRVNFSVAEGESLRGALIKVVDTLGENFQINVAKELTANVTNRQGAVTATEKLYLHSVSPDELVFRTSGKEGEEVVINKNTKILCFYEITSFSLGGRVFTKAADSGTVVFIEPKIN